MQVDIAIIGGGIVGLATALRLSEGDPSLRLCVLEKEKELAAHQTGHNSGVIHSGIYYKPGSLKARNCIDGYRQLITFCDKHEIPYELCGKIIVATEQKELPALENIYKRGLENGLEGLKKLDVAELKEHEPHVNGIAGVSVPQTGIVNYKKVAETYAKLIKEAGGMILTGEKVTDILLKTPYTEVITENRIIQARMVINCGGLYSDKLAALTQRQLNIRIIPFRGEYYELKPEKRYLVKNLIYPVPNPDFPFLGVHFTRMIEGGVEAGPNAVLAFAREGYRKSDINMKELLETLLFPGFRKIAGKYWREGWEEFHRSFSKKAFTEALQRLIPEIRETDLVPGGAGVRAQACDGEGNLLDDFLIIEDHAVINVCNAPSPAATSSLSIGNSIAAMAFKKMNITTSTI